MGREPRKPLAASLTRRTLLTGALGGVALVIGGGDRAFAAPDERFTSSATGGLRIRAFDEREIDIFDREFARVRSLTIPSVFEVVGAAAGPLDCEVVYDDRIVLLAGMALVSESKRMTFHDVVAQEPAAGRARSTVRNAEMTGRSTARIALPLSVRNLYPEENVGDSAGVGITITDARGRQARFDSSAGGWAAVAAWGLEIFPAWAEAIPEFSSSRARYRYPSHVRVRSVGPTASPSGTVLRLDVDARFVDSIAPTAETAAIAPAVEGIDHEGARTLSIALPSLAVGEELLLVLEAAPSASAPRRVDALRRPLVAVDGTSPTGTYARATGRTVVVDVTNAGNPEVPMLASGTV